MSARDRRKNKKSGDEEDEDNQDNGDSENNDDKSNEEYELKGFAFGPFTSDFKDMEKQLNKIFKLILGAGADSDPNLNFPFGRIMEDVMKKTNEELKDTMKKQNGEPPTPDQMTDLIRKTMEQQGIKGSNIKGPFVFGFNMNMDKNGKVRFNPIGNIKPKRSDGQESESESEIKPDMEISESRDPVIDLFEENENVTIIAEMPGVSKEEIKMEFEDDTLILSARNDDTQKNYYSKVKLPCKINSKEAKARFVNGILELKIKKL